MKSKIFVLTAVHNELEDTKKLLESIFSQSYKNFSVYIVDDGSTDGTKEFILKKYPNVNILRGDGTLWWTGSLNFGLTKILKKANSNDYIWIINNDCTFYKTTLQCLYNFVGTENEKTIAGSVVIDAKTLKVWDSGVKIDWAKMEFRRFEYLKNSQTIDALSTKGTLYPMSVFKNVGLFDQKHFPHYFSDYEFSIRAKRHGYHLKICSRSRVHNRTERTGQEDISFSRKSKLNPFAIFNFVRLVCPPKYRLKNYLLLLSKLIHGKK